jgi:hypothetical protein
VDPFIFIAFVAHRLASHKAWFSREAYLESIQERMATTIQKETAYA